MLFPVSLDKVVSETDIIRLFELKDPDAFRVLYEHYAGKMMAVCVRYMGDPDQAKDVLQDGFIKVHRHIHEFRSEGSLEGWIRKIVVHTALRALKKEKLRGVSREEVQEFSLNTSFDEALDKLSVKELLELIAGLPAGYRTVFNLYVMEDYSHKQIASELGISESTSRSQLTKARSMLQDLILRQRNSVSKSLPTF